VLATWASALSTLVGTAAALALSRFRFAGRGGLQLMLSVPIMVPHIVLGVGLLLAFRVAGLSKSFLLLVIGHMTITLPYVVLTTSHRLRAIPANIEEAARTLGANRTQTFCAITLPLALPAILASLLFAFMSSFDEVTATLFWLPANTQTVPTQIMAMLQFSVDQKINALSALLILGSVVLAVLALALGRALSTDNQKPRGNPT
jgi:spermidine/putrescine transport system permease protein